MNKNHYIIPIFVPHIGCPHDCVFCNQNTITGKKKHIEITEVTRETAIKIIEDYLKTINISNGNRNKIIEVSFFGGTFTAIPIEKQVELLKVAYEYKCKGSINYIRLSTRPDYIDVEELNLLKKYGVDIIELGVQSLDDEVLRASGRGHSIEVVKVASNLIKDFKIILGLQIMLGLPKDNFKKDIETVKKICEIKPDVCRIYPALVIKDTPMETMLLRGQYKPYTLEEAVSICTLVYSMLISNNIKVIRVGLQPTEEINEGAEIVDGPFHPAFRELVESSIMNEMIFEYLSTLKIDFAEIYLNPKNVSKLYSNKKYYFKEYKEKYFQGEVILKQDSKLNMDTVIISNGKKNKSMSLNEFMTEKSKKEIIYI